MESGTSAFFNGPLAHRMRNALAHVPRSQHTVVAAAILPRPSASPTAPRPAGPGATSQTKSEAAGPSSGR